MTNKSDQEKAAELARTIQNGGPELKRSFNRYSLHPEEIPEEAPAGDPWKPFTLADAYQERPPIEYIAAGLFALPSLNIVYGAPGTLKSMVMADLAITVAGGGEWLQPAPWDPKAKTIKTMQAPVMWLDFDNGQLRTHERIGALARARSLPENAPIFYYSMPQPWLDASKPDSIGRLIQRVNNQGAKFVVVDNLGTVSGGVDENSGQMIGVMGELRQLAEGTGAAIVVIHHQRKSNGFASRAGDSLRGHSSIEAAIDLALLVEREEGSDTITLKSTKTRGVDVYPFAAAFTYENNSQGNLATAKFYGLAANDTNSGRAIENAIVEALKDTRLNQTALIKAVMDTSTCEAGRDRVRDMVKRLSKTGTIRPVDGPNNSKVYELA